MPSNSGQLSALGLAPETTWGTPVAPADFFPFSSEGFKDGPEAITELQLRGLLDSDPKFKGMQAVSGSFGGVAYPTLLGHLLRAALGAPVTTGAGAYTHTFTPAQAAFSSDAPLPPYSIAVKRDAVQTVRYAGNVLTKLSLKFSQGGILSVDTAWLGKDADATYTMPAVTLPTGNPFHLTADLKRNAVSFADIADLTVEITNNVEVVKTINNSSLVNRMAWTSGRTITVTGSADFQSQQFYNDFKAFTAVPWSFEWTEGSDSLTLTIPALLITDAGAAVGGAGRINLSFNGEAQYSAGDGYALQAVLVNSKASY